MTGREFAAQCEARSLEDGRDRWNLVAWRAQAYATEDERNLLRERLAAVEKERDGWKAAADHLADRRHEVVCDLEKAELAAAATYQELMGVRKERDQLRAELAAAEKQAGKGYSAKKRECGHNEYWTTHYGNCMACRAGQAEAERDELRAKLDAMQRRTDRHDHAKNLGQAVEGDAETMARLMKERDDARKDARCAREEFDNLHRCAEGAAEMREHWADHAREAHAKLAIAVKALGDLEEWVAGVAQDYVPNEVFHKQDGFRRMEQARRALAEIGETP